MRVPLTPPGESARLAALRDLQILDTLPEQVYDDLTMLASQICGTPIALVSLVDAERQWFKSRVGLDAPQTPRDISFCGHVVAEGEMLIVPDATTDERFLDNPLVTGAPDIRFYAGAPIVFEGGHILGTLCVIDRRARELSEAQFEQLRALARQVSSQLELRAALQARESDQERIQAALQDARGANAAKTTLVAKMSHDLRTPLSAIIGFAEMVEEEVGDDPDLVDAARCIQSSSKHILELAGDLLDVAKLEAGQLSLNVESFDLADALRRVESSTRNLVEANENSFSVEVTGAPETVRLDRRRLTQCLVNLLSNAGKFTNDGTVRLSVGPSPEPGFVDYAVSDTGIGMSLAQIARVFEDFSQAHEDIEKEYGGTGLGLAITRNLAELMGGTIDVQSKVGVGTTFTLRLPERITCPEESAVLASDRA